MAATASAVVRVLAALAVLTVFAVLLSDHNFFGPSVRSVGPKNTFASSSVKVQVDWTKVSRRTTTTPTFQNSVDPFYRVDDSPYASPIGHQAFQLEKKLGASLVRHVPWFPYPRLAVAQMTAPTKTDSGWDFSLIDPITTSFVEAMENRSIVMNFATPPQWLFKTPKGPVVTPEDPNVRFLDYEQGTELRDPSMRELVSYYTSLYSYYCKGGFTDETGTFRKGYHFKFDWFEIFNEADFEYAMSMEQYTERYDAIVTALQKLFPEAKFVGLGLGGHNDFSRYVYFLHAGNHNPPSVPVDGFSFHFYALTDASMTTYEKAALSVFTQTDTFLQEVDQILLIKKEYRHEAQIFINEIGCGHYPEPAFGWAKYWTLCSSMYAYLYSELAKKGVEVVGQSQMIGFVNGTNAEWPSTSMMDWRDGQPNARYWMLKMLIDRFGSAPTMKSVINTSLVSTSDSKAESDDVYAQGFIVNGHAGNPSAAQTVLLVHKGASTTSAIDVSLDVFSGRKCSTSASGAPRMCFVDASTAPHAYSCSDVVGGVVTMRPGMVAVVDCIVEAGHDRLRLTPRVS